MWERLAPEVAETLVKARLVEAERRWALTPLRPRRSSRSLRHAIAARVAAAIHTQGPCCAPVQRRIARQEG
ncbi:MAG: hypothetical protein WEB04_07540 [Dehalococcoidia bacterium]